MKYHYAADLDPAASVVLAADVDALMGIADARLTHIERLEAALRDANADLKAVWIETGKGLEGLKRTEVALGLTAETAVNGCPTCGSQCECSCPTTDRGEKR